MQEAVVLLSGTAWKYSKKLLFLYRISVERVLY